MRVRATQRGFFGGVFREPDRATAEFDISSPEEFSAEWMEYIDPPVEPVVEPVVVEPPVKEPVKEPVAPSPAPKVADKL